jgi:hypothetical protein
MLVHTYIGCPASPKSCFHLAKPFLSVITWSCTNHEPHCATNVNVKVTVYARGQGSSKQDVVLADIGPDELPLEFLGSDGQYPIPWALGKGGSGFKTERRFAVELEWNDARGKQAGRIPPRKGNIGSVGFQAACGSNDQNLWMSLGEAA